MNSRYFRMRELYAKNGDSITPSICSAEHDFNYKNVQALMRVRFENPPAFIKSWRTPIMSKCREDRLLQFSDMMPDKSYGSHIFSDRAYRVLKPFLEQIGIFLPVLIDESIYWTWLGDQGKKEMFDFDGSCILAFENIFRIRLQPGISVTNLPDTFRMPLSGGIYVNESIKNVVIQSGLTGIAFHPVTFLTADD